MAIHSFIEMSLLFVFNFLSLAFLSTLYLYKGVNCVLYRSINIIKNIIIPLMYIYIDNKKNVLCLSIIVLIDIYIE